MLFVYATLDNYLNDAGRLGFVITQTVFKTKGAGDGFRRFRFDDGGRLLFIRPDAVHDLSAMQVFEGAVNRTAVITCTRSSSEFEYPVNYFLWRGPSVIGQDASLEDVRRLTSRTKVAAAPVDRGNPTAPWITAPKAALTAIEGMLGDGAYRAYASCCTWMNGVYWIRVLGRGAGNGVLIENLHDVGKIKVEHVQMSIEPDLIYHLVRGRDIARWNAEPSVQLILTQDPATRTGIPEAVMKRSHPRTFAYFKKFEKQLRGRSGYRKFFDESDAFYSVYNVGEYSVAPYRVVWAGEVATSLDAAVITPDSEGKAVLTDQTAYQVPVESLAEADFLCAMLNSLPVRAFYKFVAYKHTSMNFIQQLALPKFDEKNAQHRSIAELGKQTRELSRKNPDGVAKIETKIDVAVARLWRISSETVGVIDEGMSVLMAGYIEQIGDEK